MGGFFSKQGTDQPNISGTTGSKDIDANIETTIKSLENMASKKTEFDNLRKANDFDKILKLVLTDTPFQKAIPDENDLNMMKKLQLIIQSIIVELISIYYDYLLQAYLIYTRVTADVKKAVDVKIKESNGGAVDGDGIKKEARDIFVKEMSKVLFKDDKNTSTYTARLEKLASSNITMSNNNLTIKDIADPTKVVICQTLMILIVFRAVGYMRIMQTFYNTSKTISDINTVLSTFISSTYEKRNQASKSSNSFRDPYNRDREESSSSSKDILFKKDKVLSITTNFVTMLTEAANYNLQINDIKSSLEQSKVNDRIRMYFKFGNIGNTTEAFIGTLENLSSDDMYFFSESVTMVMEFLQSESDSGVLERFPCAEKDSERKKLLEQIKIVFDKIVEKVSPNTKPNINNFLGYNYDNEYEGGKHPRVSAQKGAGVSSILSLY